MISFKEFTIPDWFSFFRLVAAPILIVLLILQEREFFTWLLFISYATDMIDGFLARRLGVAKPSGSQIDSLGDQVTFLLGVTGILVFEFEFMRDNYFLILLVFSFYIFQMVYSLIKYGKMTAFHTYLAKLSAILQGGFILWTLFFGPIYWLFYLVIGIGLVETLEEIALIRIYDHWVTDVKGIYWARKEEWRKEKEGGEE